MHLKSRLGILGGLVGVAIFGASLVLSGTTPVEAFGGRGHPTPDGFDRYLVYMANGVIDPDAPADPDAAMFFQKEIMGRSNAEIEEQRQLAREFFEERFGLNFDNGTADMEMFMFDPENNYRAYTIDGESVPSEGWVVRDGGFRAVVTADGGVTLGGEFDGVHVPQGTAFVFGDYNILKSGPGASGHRSAHGDDTMVLHYRSGDPLIRDQFGVLAFRCGLVDSATDLGIEEADWDGMAQGVVRPPEELPNGDLKISIRNVLTFPPR